ncbi:MAG: hypothetical protein H6973_18225 [Gammaproteobacteria bacterium]|nr:hypothetical protein [Gammaproteobacteria bacterium]
MPLTERDEEVLKHVARYRLTTTDALRRLFFPEAKPGGEKNIVRRLTGDYLQPQPLYGKRVYYQLTPKAAKVLGESEESATPFGPQALVRLYGVLAFCCLGKTIRPVFTRTEFIQAFSGFAQALDLGQNHFYLDFDGKTTRLGQILVEQGGEYQRLVNKCRKLIERGRELPGFQEIINDELFVISIVLAEESKREMLLSHLRKNPLPVWCRAEVAQDLGYLMPHLA